MCGAKMKAVGGQHEVIMEITISVVPQKNELVSQ